MHYGSLNGGVWQSEVIDTGGYAWSELVFDASDTPHVAWQAEGDARYATKSGGAWQVDVLGSARSSTDGIALALDGNGNPRVAYSTSSVPKLLLADKSSGNWNSEIILAGSVEYLNLLYDGAGHAHLAYSGPGQDKLVHTTNASGVWVQDIIESEPSGRTGGYASLALTSNDLPHIAYKNFEEQELRYASFDGNDWTIDMVDDRSNTGGSASLVFDAQAQPHILFGTYSGTSYLEHATIPEPSSLTLFACALCGAARRSRKRS